MMQLGSSVLVALITAGGYVMVAWINGNNKQQQKEIANNLEKITNQMQSIQEEVKRTNKLAELNVESIRHSQQFLLYDAMERALKSEKLVRYLKIMKIVAVMVLSMTCTKNL